MGSFRTARVKKRSVYHVASATTSDESDGFPVILKSININSHPGVNMWENINPGGAANDNIKNVVVHRRGTDRLLPF